MCCLLVNYINFPSLSGHCFVFLEGGVHTEDRIDRFILFWGYYQGSDVGNNITLQLMIILFSQMPGWHSSFKFQTYLQFVSKEAGLKRLKQRQHLLTNSILFR